MSVPVRLGAVAALLAACTIDVSSKTKCNADTDCSPGYVCTAKRCGPSNSGGGGIAGGRGGGGGGGTGGSAGTFDGGGDAPPPRLCPTSLVNACPDTDPGGCAQTFCGGHLPRYGIMDSLLVTYKIDPNANFSDSYKNAIRASASAWARASDGFVTFKDCSNPPCPATFISVVAGPEDGIKNPDDAVPLLPMPADSGGRLSPHKIAHQWGHALGLSHTYQRADRDRYMGFDPEIWCAAGGSGLPPLCAAGPADPPGLPAVTTGTFGVFDGRSKMNGLRSEGICGAEAPDEDSDEPTIGDISALLELFVGATNYWSPFQPIGQFASSNQPLDYQLAPGVDPTGSPQIAEVDYANPEIFVRGTDDNIYTTTRSDLMTSPTATWNSWKEVAGDVDADPAVVFAWLANPATLYLAVRSKQDGQIHLRARRGPEAMWDDGTSLGAPSAGAASAPALASGSLDALDSLAVVVRGGDGLIYWLACTDPTDDCATSASQPNAWKPLPPPPPGIFVGKPAVIWPLDNSGLTIAAVRDNRAVIYITGVESGGTTWAPADPITADLAPDDPDPGVAITIQFTPGEIDFFARNGKGLLVGDTRGTSYIPIGGILTSPPGAFARYYGAIMRTDVAAIIDDHGHPGVWWRYYDTDYQPPCHYNRPMTCLECGLP